MIRALIVVTLSALVTPAVGAQVDPWSAAGAPGGSHYETGFEEFVLGSIADQHGWVGINGRFTIEATNPDAGARHFRGTSSGLAWSFARSPFVSGTSALTRATARVNVGASSPAAIWEFTPGIANQGAITTVRIKADRSIHVLIASAIPEGLYVPTGVNAPAGYFTLDVLVTRATGAFEVRLDGATIATGQGLLPGGIEAVIIYSDMEDGTAGHTFDMDELVIDADFSTGTESPSGTLELSPARPSPFRGEARIQLSAGVSAHVTATLHDALGRRLAVLMDRTLPTGATETLVIDGSGLAPGAYVVRVARNGEVVTRRVVRVE